LRDHVVDLRLNQATGVDGDLAQHRAALTQALGAGFVQECVSKMSSNQVACALSATDLAEATACAGR
jgi:hypothetical protein